MDSQYKLLSELLSDQAAFITSPKTSLANYWGALPPAPQCLRACYECTCIYEYMCVKVFACMYVMHVFTTADMCERIAVFILCKQSRGSTVQSNLRGILSKGP